VTALRRLQVEMSALIVAAYLLGSVITYLVMRFEAS
jgi:hypothetical protein